MVQVLESQPPMWETENFPGFYPCPGLDVGGIWRMNQQTRAFPPFPMSEKINHQKSSKWDSFQTNTKNQIIKSRDVRKEEKKVYKRFISGKL